MLHVYRLQVYTHVRTQQVTRVHSMIDHVHTVRNTVRDPSVLSIMLHCVQCNRCLTIKTINTSTTDILIIVVFFSILCWLEVLFPSPWTVLFFNPIDSKNSNIDKRSSKSNLKISISSKGTPLDVLDTIKNNSRLPPKKIQKLVFCQH